MAGRVATRAQCRFVAKLWTLGYILGMHCIRETCVFDSNASKASVGRVLSFVEVSRFSRRLPLQGSFLPVKTVKTFSNEKTCKLRTDVVIARAAKDTGNEKPEAGIALFGEDAAAFSLEQQSLSSWVKFFGVLGVVSVILYAVWIQVSGEAQLHDHRHESKLACTQHRLVLTMQPGAGLADDYVAFLKSFSDNPEVVILEILLLFAIVHSGLAGLR